MTSRWLAAGPEAVLRRLWVLLACAGAAWSAAGCGDVESCTELDRGCLNGPPDSDGACRFGLVLDSTGTTCKEEGATTPVGNGGSCSCPSGQLCRSDNTCSDPCSTPTNLPAAKPMLPACRTPAGETAYTFSKAAVAACYQACSHRAEYCGVACDPTKECTDALAGVQLTTQCPTLAVECAMTACETARDTPCLQQQCAGLAAPNCAGVVCTNTCANPTFNNDGLCDDGDLSNASSGVCDWGSDCGDCGPRRGTAPTFSVQPGDPCVDLQQCGGDIDDVRLSTGWCLVPGATEPARCLPDCSLGKKCPAGFKCSDLVRTTDNTNVTDNNNKQASACFPTACSN